MGKADISINNWLENKNRFADLFNGIIFEGKQIIQPEELKKISPVASVSIKNRRGKRKNMKKYRDIIMLWKNEVALILLANESQDKIHYAMPPKVMIYDSLDYESQIKDNWNNLLQNQKDLKKQGKALEHLTAEEYLSRFRKKDKLIPVISLVFYYGEKEWDAPIELYDMFQLQGSNNDLKILKKYLPNYKINLIDAQRFQNANRFQSDLQIIFNMLKCRENKQDLEEYIYKHEDYFNNVDDETRQALKAFLGIEKIPGEDLIQKGENMNMCKAIQEMYDDGYENGTRAGGEEKLIELVIKKMRKGQTAETIAYALEEDKEVIQAIYNAVNSCGIDSPAKEIRLKMME